MSIAEAAPAPDPVLKNETFDELKVGDSASLVRIVGRDDVDLFAAVSGDVNPAHLDATFAATDLFGHVVAHGMWTAALVSAVLGTKLPGPGTIYLAQDLRFLKPVAPGDTITVTVSVKNPGPEDRELGMEDYRRFEVMVLRAAHEIDTRVNALSPGPLNTRAASGIDHFDALIDDARARAPERRLVTTADVGAMATGLVSDFARNVTGNIAYVDAGYHVMS